MSTGAITHVLDVHNFYAMGLALTLALFAGVPANRGVAALCAINAPVCPTMVLSAGVRLMIGFGCAVAILVPIVASYLLNGHGLVKARSSLSRPYS